MKKISNEEMVAAYEVAKRIRDGSLTRTVGIEDLHERFALNRGSAGDTITNIERMLEGKLYTRTNNAFATEHFLEMIHRDYGTNALRKAISSVEQHIQYYQTLPTGSKLPSISKIVRKYREIAKLAPTALKSISVFFEHTLGAKLANSRWSWGAVNSATKQVFLRVWEDQIESADGIERVSVLKTDWNGTSPGFQEREQHIVALRNHVEGYGVLCAAKNPNTTLGREIKDFDRRNLLKFGQLIETGNRVYAQIVDRISTTELARSQAARTGHSPILSDLRTILDVPGDVTMKEILANARVGQGAFRAQVLKMWGSRCCVTGSTTLDAIRASHIKPWRDSDDRERLDPYNGLPLIATLDALFDAGLITFSSEGCLVASKMLNQQEKEILGLMQLRFIEKPSDNAAEYLSYHRDRIFVDAK